MRLADRVWSALDRAGGEATGTPGLVFGAGDPSLPLMGYCPACRRGTVSVWIVNTDPPEIDVGACSAGCSEATVMESLR
jgi:hypothetical protein